MIEKVIISATVEKETREYIKEFAKKEKRSFSNMIDLFLQVAIKLEKEKTENK